MYEIIQSATFSKWLSGLARMRIHVRLDRVRLGNFGDAVPIGEGLFELRIHYGPGYRLYYVQRDMRFVILLCGGDKTSPPRDIEKAKIIAKEWRD
ncbi:MAG: type II toxin-antitoxin system RelE/ParE family toxin [Smithella sp.]|nr:type II toxin-antitoxin system RelE/ParE family toxin [Smithella sp.]